MADNIKDLDTLIPENKKIKVNGKLYDVKPARLKDFISIQKLFLSLKGAEETKIVEALDKINETLKPIVPDIDEMNLTVPQFMALIEFVYKEGVPEQAQTTEKKTV